MRCTTQGWVGAAGLDEVVRAGGDVDRDAVLDVELHPASIPVVQARSARAVLQTIPMVET